MPATLSNRFSVVLFVAATLAPIAAQASQDEAMRARLMRRIQNEQERYHRWDANSDGILTRNEWRGSAAAFRQLDANGDGELSGREVWIRLPADASAYNEEDQRREDMLVAFSRADRNDDGRVSRAEWWSDRGAFNRIDANRDGVLTAYEFLYTSEPIDVPAGTTGDMRAQTRAYQAGYQRGLSEGRQAGKEDKTLRNQWDLEGQRELEQADSGYSNDLGRRDEYQSGYRAGFRLGYKQGFGPR